jgi:short-subunit dehydrogenase
LKNIAIVTGASSGIGRSFLKLIIKERGIFGGVPFDEIWAIARNADKLNSVINSLEDERVLPVICDLSDPGNLAELEEQLASEKPQVGLLVNCAGMGIKGAVEDQPAKAIEDTLDINCTSLSKLTRICLPYMIEKDMFYSKANGPRIINIASSAGFLPQPGFAAYAASKSYVINLSRALAFELADYGICVTTVCPGPVNTEFQSKATGGASAEFTGFRQYVVADADKLAEASLRASIQGRRMLVYGFSQKALHLASKIVPTDLILYIESRLMPVEHTQAEPAPVVTTVSEKIKEEET